MEEDPDIESLSAESSLAGSAGDESVPRLALRAVLRPVGAGAGGGGLDGAERLLLETLLPIVEGGLNALCQAPASITTRLELEDAGFAPLRDEAFGFELERAREGAPPRRFVVTLDLASARAIVDALEQRLAGLRGFGELTDTELGLLEYAVLESIERLVRSRRAATAGLRVTDFQVGQELRATLGTGELEARTSFRLGVGGQAGVAVLWAEPQRQGPACVLRAPRPAMPDHVWVALVAPPIELDATRFASLRPGDVVLLGVSALDAFATRCRIVTATGWELAEASLVTDSATLATARVGAWRPMAARLEPARAGRAAVTATLGWTELSAQRLEGWRGGAMLDFARPESGAAALHGPTRSWAAEFVRVGEEVGLRVLA